MPAARKLRGRTRRVVYRSPGYGFLSRSVAAQPAPASSPIIDPSILSVFNPKEGKSNLTSSASCPIAQDLNWYLPWLRCQIYCLPECLIELLSGSEKTRTIDLSRDSTLYQVFISVNQCIRESGSLGIDEIVEYLIQEEILVPAIAEAHISLLRRLLVFAILGWQSMLYLPAFNSCPIEELAVYQDVDQPHSGLVFDTFKMSVDLADRPMSIMLKGYGNILLSRSEELTKVTCEGNTDTSTWFSTEPAEVNADLLHALLRVDFRWVDTMALHLDYDSSTRTLSLFRYPSLCVAMLQSEGALYSFASTELNSSDPRANHDEITDILKETLLSYRLLFGQTRSSRLLFRRLLRSSSILSWNSDPFLSGLCSERYFSHPFVLQDRLVYFAHRDFPVLGGRIKHLADELKGARPKNWRELLRDRRDTTQYWTFWLVAIIGGVSVALSLVQVILQAVSLLQS